MVQGYLFVEHAFQSKETGQLLLEAQGVSRFYFLLQLWDNGTSLPALLQDGVLGEVGEMMSS